MDGLQWKTLLKWMMGGYHDFRKHPNKEFNSWPNIKGKLIVFISPEHKAS